MEALGDFAVGVDVNGAVEHGLAAVQTSLRLLLGQFDGNLSAAPISAQVEHHRPSKGEVNALHVVLLAHGLAFLYDAAGLHDFGEDEQVGGVDVAEQLLVDVQLPVLHPHPAEGV